MAFDFYSIYQIASAHNVAFKENLSWWDPGEEYKTKISKYLNLPQIQEVQNYRYTCSVEELSALSRKLTGENLLTSGGMNLSLFPNGSIAILNVLRYLKIRAHCKKLLIVGVPYFSVPLVCQTLGLSYTFSPMEETKQFHVPSSIEDCDCVWFTNPLYCSGHALTSTDLNEVARIIASGKLCIFDECITPNKHELVRVLGAHKNSIYLYSPLKVVAINGIKFSVVVSSDAVKEALVTDSDFFTGALSTSVISAVRLFLSKDYDAILGIRDNHIENNLALLHDLSLDYNGVCLPNYVFYQCTCPLDVEVALGKVCQIAKCCVIPAQASGIPMHAGEFGFRINLLLDGGYIEDKIMKIQAFLCGK